MNKSILLCGVGGQGTVLASKLIAASAMKKGYTVMSGETIGMAQKGGSVVSHIRFGDGIHSPMLGKGTADVITAFEPAEAVSALPYLKKDGVAIVSSRPIKPVTATITGSAYDGTEMLEYLKANVKNLIIIDTKKACEELGTYKAVNTLLLGAAVRSGALGIDENEMKEIIKEKINPKFYDINIKAFNYNKEN